MRVDTMHDLHPLDSSVCVYVCVGVGGVVEG